jgi:hypothetical protein
MIRSKKGFTLIELLIIVVAIVGIGLTIISGFGGDGSFLYPTDSKKARGFLTEQGYTDIQITGYEPFACSDEDDYSTGFIAKNWNGRTVSGVVCSSFWGKYATIRFK